MVLALRAEELKVQESNSRRTDCCAGIAITSQGDAKPITKET